MTALTALCALAVAAPIVVTSASAADPARAVTDARRAIDRLANRYFAAEQQLSALDARIAQIDRRLASASHRVAATRALAAERAAAMYRAAGNDALALDMAGTSLIAARRAQLMGAVNEVTQHDIDRYTTASADLRRARHDLEQARTTERRELSDLAAQRHVLDARLAAVQQAYRAELAARHAAAVLAASAARRTTTSRRAPATNSPSAGAATPATLPPPAPAPTPAPPPPQPGQNPHHNDPFLSCVRQRESGGYYGAISPSGYYGAYQFSPSTWNVTASHAGRISLVGVRPDHASAWDQDDLAWTLYQWQGAGPWGGHCP